MYGGDLFKHSFGVCHSLLLEILAVFSTHMHSQMAPLDNCSENVLRKIWCKMHPYYDNKRMYLILSPVFLVINNYINRFCCQKLKPSISSHSKPHSRSLTRHLKCFVLNTWKIERPCTRPCTRLWMTRNSGLMTTEAN